MLTFEEESEMPSIGMNEMWGGMRDCEEWKKGKEPDFDLLFNKDLMTFGEQPVSPEPGVNYTNTFDVPNVSSNLVCSVSPDQRELYNWQKESELGNLLEVMEVDAANRYPHDFDCYHQDPNVFMDGFGSYQGYQSQEQPIEQLYEVHHEFQNMYVENPVDLERIAHRVNPQEYEHEVLPSSQVPPLFLPKPPARYNTRKLNSIRASPYVGYNVDTATASRRKRGGGSMPAAQEMNSVQKHRKNINDFLTTAPEVIKEYTQIDQSLAQYIGEMYQLHNTLVDLMQHAVPQITY